MKDQYDNLVPEDLVLLDSSWIGDFLKETELDKINRLNWYKPRGEAIPGNFSLIFVSAGELEKCIEGLVDFYPPEEMGLEKVNWLKIDDCLHRWNETDGFYHA